MRVGREAFLFLSPKKRDEKKYFAQCGSCRMFVEKVQGLSGSRCVIHGSSVRVSAGASCGFWVDWPTEDGKPNEEVVEDHAAELAKGIPGSVRAGESGLVDEPVQCHRCAYFGPKGPKCRLFEELNKRLPEQFSLATGITKNSCCNAWTEESNPLTGMK
jgi:hypothetical protein